MQKVINKDKVKQLMNVKNIKNQTELAKYMGISKNELSRILSPQYDYLKSNIRKLCEVLDTNLDDIVAANIEKKIENKEIVDLEKNEFVDISNDILFKE